MEIVHRVKVDTKIKENKNKLKTKLNPQLKR